MKTRQLILELDEIDYDTIQDYMADQQKSSALICQAEGTRPRTILPDGDSNLAGALMAECVRNVLEYRSMYEDQS